MNRSGSVASSIDEDDVVRRNLGEKRAWDAPERREEDLLDGLCE